MPKQPLHKSSQNPPKSRPSHKVIELGDVCRSSVQLDLASHELHLSTPSLGQRSASWRAWHIRLGRGPCFKEDILKLLGLSAHLEMFSKLVSGASELQALAPSFATQLTSRSKKIFPAFFFDMSSSLERNTDAVSFGQTHVR